MDAQRITISLSLNGQCPVSVRSIPDVGSLLNCLFDDAATCSLVTEAAAKTLNLVGEKIMMEISTVNATKTIDSAIYHGPPQGESVMALFDIFYSMKTGIGWKKMRYCVNDQSSIQRDWVNLA